MQIYYRNLQAINQRTKQLENEPCGHCDKRQLVSHGFVRKKRVGGEPEAIGKRVFCSNRHRHTGCGRTMQLYVDTTVRYLHHAGSALVSFVLALIAGMSIARAYEQATGTATPRHAYRWLNRFGEQLSTWRSVPHRPPLQETAALTMSKRPVRLQCVMSAFQMLLRLFEAPLCSTYQRQLQRSFL